jgi:hypothetical protein
VCVLLLVQAINHCTEFSSNAFEEFGLTEVYAYVTSKCDESTNYVVFDYQIFRKSTCTGNPFGQVNQLFHPLPRIPPTTHAGCRLAP